MVPCRARSEVFRSVSTTFLTDALIRRHTPLDAERTSQLTPRLRTTEARLVRHTSLKVLSSLLLVSIAADVPVDLV